jgi:prepilin peptidase CpaA
MTHISPQIAAAALVLIAAVTDIRGRRIPNWLTLAGIIAGFLLGIVTGGLPGVGRAAGGMFLGFGAYFVLYCLHAMGAGDVKLMAAVGAIVGPSNWIVVLVATALAGGVLAVVLMIAKARVRETLWNTAYILNELVHLRPPYRRRSHLDVKHPGALNMPHAIAIAAGTLFCLFWTHLR